MLPPFVRSNPLRQAAVALLVILAFGPGMGTAQLLPLGPAGNVAAEIAAGDGEGTMRIGTDDVVMEGTARALGRFTDNVVRNLCVFNYVLPHPVAIPAPSDYLSLAVDSPESNSGAGLTLRVIVEDQKGRRWAVGTRLLGGGSRVPTTHGFERLVTYRWNVSEIGRLDPSVALPLAGGPGDGYVSIAPPLKWAGFQVTAGTPGKPFRFTVAHLQGLVQEGRPDPYWMLASGTIWNKRLKQGGRYGRYGFGPDEPQPYLKASDLDIGAGDYAVSWEVLGADEWTPAASGTGTWKVGADRTEKLSLPLLAEGTYQVRFTCLKSGERQPREFALSYVVIRNREGKTLAAPPELSGTKLLRWSSNAPAGNVWKSGKDAVLTLRGAGKEDSGTRLEWQVESTDGRLLGHGQTEEGRDTSIPLGTYFRDQPVLWITGTLYREGRVVDVSRRIAGLAAGPEASGGGTAPKLDLLRGKFRRAKGDWNEGGTPLATDYAVYEKLLGPWLDETRDAGYNIVELSAPWHDLNPLPGVYQFGYLDHFVAEAEKRGLAVELRVHPSLGSVPTWVPREFMQDENGLAHGIWGGGSDLICTAASEPLRLDLDRYLEALAAHYRRDPRMLGVTLNSLFFDHDWVDQSQLGQNVDYSDAMRRSFVAALKRKYGSDLGRASAAHGTAYRSWDDVTIPHPRVTLDAAGRVEPRTDGLWTDWVAHKIAVVRDFRLGEVDALRRGDPSCYAGMYASETTLFYLDEIQAKHCEITHGSMEEQFPFHDEGIPGRFEPHAKIARYGTLVDVGMTNLLMAAPPGFHSIFNYWSFDATLASLPVPEREAEGRLAQWFAAVDPLVGAVPVSDAGAGKAAGCYLVAHLPLLYSLQHFSTGRLDDYLKPFLYRAGSDKVVLDPQPAEAADAGTIGSHAYVYVPYSADVLGGKTLDALERYVSGGGTLVLEATSGFWKADATQTSRDGNALGSLFGLPPAVPHAAPPGAAAVEEAKPKPNAPFGAEPFAFRIQPFVPPVDDQPTPWIHTIAKAYLRPFRFQAPLPPGASVLAAFPDGSPAAVLVSHGKGRVLLFCGTLDWIGCPGLASRLDAWGRGRPMPSSLPEDPASFVRAFRKDGHVFLLGRRFIGQVALDGIKGGQMPPELRQEKSLAVVFPEGTTPSDGLYAVRELLSRRELGTFPAEKLVSSGIDLSLRPGEAFLLDAVPVPRP